ncbi:MAG: alkaline phosphatase [Victivallaceae bacterium]|nr:alkaline phosphatase [Victivallaceae bacterium]
MKMRLLLYSFCMLCGALSAQNITPINLNNGANSFFRDDTAGDRKGGWTDQGGNDLHMLPSGKADFCGVPFLISADKDGKSCIVLGGKASSWSWLPSQTIVKTPPLKGNCVYLLHSAAFVNNKKASDGKLPLAGRLTVQYTDDTSSEFRVRTGRDTADWHSANSIANASRVWTIYNNNAQVSLFASKFQINNKPVAALDFNSDGGSCIWMIAGAAIGDDVTIGKVQTPPKTPTRKFDFPSPRHNAVTALPRQGIPQNIILIIGDGMGFGSLDAASLAAYGRTGALLMQTLPVKIDCNTLSQGDRVTDSAAAATAIAGGYKTANSRVGMTADQQPRTTFAEAARDSGRAVGLVTTDNLQGATPAGFMAHVPGRGDYAGISVFAANSRFHVLIGNSGSRQHFLPKKDGVDLLAQMKSAGYVEANTDEMIAAAPSDKRIFGFPAFKNSDPASPGRIAGAVFERRGKNPHGFFVMVECSWPDGGGHGNNPDLSISGVSCVEFVLRAALDFAERNPNTLIVVTADHETGKVSAAMPKNGKAGFPEVTYRSTNHSEARVPFFAVGPGADLFTAGLDNTAISRVFAELWNLKLK